MNTIESYLENIFQSLPKTEQMLRLKGEFLSDMEAKYHELRQSGKTENEAIGKVIGEFGNIDELLEEMGIAVAKKDIIAEKDELPIIAIKEAREFLSVKSKCASLIAIGVASILISVAIFIGFMGLLENDSIMPVVLLLIMIIPSIGLFIYSATLLEKFNFIENGAFNLEYSAKAILKEEVESLNSKWTIALIIGVSLCILSAAVLIAISGFTNSILGVVLLLIIVAIAVFIFILSGSAKSSYEKLLKIGDFEPQKQQANKVIEGVAGFIWPLAVCIFLIWGFMYDGWSIAWIVFPITGVLFGGFSAICTAINKK